MAEKKDEYISLERTTATTQTVEDPYTIRPSRDFFEGASSNSRRNSVSLDETWSVFNKKFSRAGVVFFCQVIILYVCIGTCLVNVSLSNGPKELWITLLSFSLGSILPSPKAKKRKIPFQSQQHNPSSSSSNSSNSFPPFV